MENILKVVGMGGETLVQIGEVFGVWVLGAGGFHIIVNRQND
jgi:hypothetical protein